MKRKKPSKITDHAVVRYLERACGIDIALIRQEIMSNELRLSMMNLGDGIYDVKNDNRAPVKAVVLNQRIVTITPFHPENAGQ